MSSIIFLLLQSLSRLGAFIPLLHSLQGFKFNTMYSFILRLSAIFNSILCLPILTYAVEVDPNGYITFCPCMGEQQAFPFEIHSQFCYLKAFLGVSTLSFRLYPCLDLQDDLATRQISTQECYLLPRVSTEPSLCLLGWSINLEDIAL